MHPSGTGLVAKGSCRAETLDFLFLLFPVSIDRHYKSTLLKNCVVVSLQRYKLFGTMRNAQ